MFAVATGIPLILMAIYTPVLILLYLIQVALVIVNKRKEQFRSSYFSLFIIEVIVSIGATLAYLFKTKLGLFPEVNSFYANFPSNAFTTALSFSSYYFIACREYTYIFIALNRLSAITMYHKYEKIWRWAIWICIPVIFGCPFISYYHLVDVKAFVRTAIINNVTYYNIDYDHSVRPWRSTSEQAFYLYLICSIISLSLNLASVIVIRWTSMEKVSSIEIRLFILGFSSFACGLPMTIKQCFFATSGSDPMSIIRFSWMNDVKALTPAILSIIFSKAIRDQLKRSFGGRKTPRVSWTD